MSWRRANLALAVAWATMLPIAIVTGWVYSIVLINVVSLYTVCATHLAGWRADVPTADED